MISSDEKNLFESDVKMKTFERGAKRGTTEKETREQEEFAYVYAAFRFNFAYISVQFELPTSKN